MRRARQGPAKVAVAVAVAPAEPQAGGSSLSTGPSRTHEEGDGPCGRRPLKMGPDHVALCVCSGVDRPGSTRAGAPGIDDRPVCSSFQVELRRTSALAAHRPCPALSSS